MLSNDREARDKVVDELKAKIRREKDLLQDRLETEEGAEVEHRPYRAKRLSEVFEKMGF